MQILALLLVLFMPAPQRGGAAPRAATALDSTTPNRINGKVVDDQKQPVRQLTLHLKDDLNNAEVATTLTFGNGTFYFDSVKLGFYVISIVDPRYLLSDTHLDLRDATSFQTPVNIIITRNNPEAIASASAGPDPYIAELNMLKMDEVAKTTTPEAFAEFSKGVDRVKMGPGRTTTIVPASGNLEEDSAEAHFKKALSIDPKFYEAQIQLGLEDRRQKRLPEAADALERAAALKDTDSRPLRMLVGLYLDQKEYQKTVDTSVKLGKLGPLSADDRFFLGIAFENMDNPAAAQQQFATAISLAPGKNPQAYLHLHNAYAKMNQLQDALSTLEDFVRLFPNDPNKKTAEDRIKKLRDAIKKNP